MTSSVLHPRHLSSMPAWDVCRVPWLLDRTLPVPWYRLENRGPEAACAVSVTLLGSARLLAALPGATAAGESLRFAVRGTDPADDSILIVKWRRPGGESYLWRAAF